MNFQNIFTEKFKQRFNIASMGFAIMLAPLTVLILFSQNTVPGEFFYPVKRGMEDVVLAAATFSPATRVAFRTDLASKRFAEAETLILADSSDISGFKEYVAQVQETSLELSRLQNAEEKEQLKQKMRSGLISDREKLISIKSRLIASGSPYVKVTPTIGPIDTSLPTENNFPLPTNTPVPVPTSRPNQPPIPTNTSVPLPTFAQRPLPTNTPVPVPTSRPNQPPIPTNTPVPLPTSTPRPTIAVVRPTSTPIPTPTPTPFIPPVGANPPFYITNDTVVGYNLCVDIYELDHPELYRCLTPFQQAPTPSPTPTSTPIPGAPSNTPTPTSIPGVPTPTSKSSSGKGFFIQSYNSPTPTQVVAPTEIPTPTPPCVEGWDANNCSFNGGPDGTDFGNGSYCGWTDSAWNSCNSRYPH